MSNQGFSVEYGDLDEYVAKNGGIADGVAGTADAHLSGSIPSDMFGDLGEETGLHGHLSNTISQLHDHVHATSHSVRSLGHAVHRARTDYQYNEDDHSEHFNKIIRK